MKIKKRFIFLFVGFLIISFAFKNPFFEIAKQIEIYNEVFKKINMYYIYDINPGELTSASIKSTLKNLDPYTNFYDEQLVEKQKIRRQGEYGGIGIATYYIDRGIIIQDVYKGYPADKAGLKVGDIITNVNGQDISNMDRDTKSMVLKGNPGKVIKLTVNRKGNSLIFNLKLDKVMINPVPFNEMINNETGYMVLTRFINQKSSQEVKRAYYELKDKGMKKMILDLRSNPGGSLFDAINIVNYFIPKGKKIVETKGKVKKMSKVFTGNKEPLDTEIPIVVLIDGRSASASEIVSGALQDYDRAVILGERSFGKGLVQRYFELSYGTQVKVTISKYYTPSGRCIQELDYANRDSETGKVPKFSDGTINTFKTKGGRTVYDGGGVTPDIKSLYPKQTTETKKLLRSRAIFDYVNQSNSTITNLESFKVLDADYRSFETFLIKKDTSFLTKQERLFKKAYNSDKTNTITSEYNSLIRKIKVDKVKKIQVNKKIIKEKIQDEIIKRNYYEKGVYQYHLKHDPLIKQAVNVLNSGKYNKILNK